MTPFATRHTTAGARFAKGASSPSSQGARPLLALVWPFVLVVVLLLALAGASLFTLSALRAYVNGEALWSKAQQEAVFHLVQYARSGQPVEYSRFRAAINVTLGDRAAREELEKADYRREIAVEGFIAGGNHPDDIGGMIALFRHFRHVPFVERAIAIWEQGDALIAKLVETGAALDLALRSSAPREQIDAHVARALAINDELRPLEKDFSATLGAGSRWTAAVLLASMAGAATMLTLLGLFQARRLIRSAEAIERELRESEARFRALTELTSDWYWEQDEQFRFTAISERVGVLTGFRSKEHLGRTRWELPWLTFDAETLRAHRAQLEAHLPFRDLEFRRPDVDGKPVWVSVSGEPRFDASGRFIGYRGTGKIITDRKLAQLEVERLNRELETRVRERTAALETANRELESFSYSIAHDLAAPLRSINARVSVLSEEYGGKLGREGQEAIDRVREATVRMGQLIDDLLRLSMASRREMHRTSVDLAGLADAIVADIAHGNEQRVVEWRIERVPPASADRDLMRIALANLLQNSFKFTAHSERALIEFGAERDQGETWYYVRDNGVGFDPAYVDQIFKPFYRLHDAREFPGTGIGLAIVERVVDRHGGRVAAESAPGRGTCIRFTLG